MKKLLLSLLALPLVIGSVAMATGQETCPEGGEWVKVDNLSGLTYTHQVSEGFKITENCYKAGTTVVYGSGATVTSTVWNKEGCPDEHGCNYKELSHASFKIVKDDKPEEPEEPEVPEEPKEEEPTEETPEVKVPEVAPPDVYKDIIWNVGK
jgi:hypothetical protein